MPATPNLNNFPSMSTMPTMSPFFPYQFPNLQQQQSFSPIAPMAGSPMSGSSMGSSPMVASPNVSDHGLSRNTIFVERKRPRITYTQEQIAYLETWYNNKNNFISTMERNQIARELNVSPNQVTFYEYSFKYLNVFIFCLFFRSAFGSRIAEPENASATLTVLHSSRQARHLQ